jgi:hypothetical protein
VLVAVIALALIGSPSTNLKITVWEQGRAQSPARVSTLVCPSTSPKCRKLAAFTTNPFAPVPPGIVCTEVYGGPEEALVTGWFRGKKVWARFTLRNGCQIARWNRVAFLFA